MKLARYWSKSVYRAPKGLEYIAWGWSDESLEDAEAMATRRAETIAKRLSEGGVVGRYGYNDRPLREELIEILAGSVESPTAVVTRNSYGCRILNTDDVMFIDIDLPWPGFFKQLRYWFDRFFDKAAKSPREIFEQEAIAQAEKLVQVSLACGIRIYRTYSGLRYLLTHSTFDPASEGTAQLMEFVKADPLYQRLCRTKDCFRARLTPKPWRCGQQKPPNRFPWASGQDEIVFRDWEKGYETEARRWATCKLIKVLGSDEMDPAIASIVEFHDRETQAESSLKLA